MALVMVIEDEEALALLLKYNLEKEGYEVVWEPRGNKALAEIEKHCPSVILLDWMLPEMSGVEICKLIRSKPDIKNIPVIMLTAKGEEEDKIRGLSAGADDYVTKPFSVPELMARVKTNLRRAPELIQHKEFVFEDIRMDLVEKKVFRGDNYIHLGPTEFRLLRMLMETPGKVFSRETLLKTVWGDNIYVESRTVDVHIRRLRKSLNRFGPDYIRTVRATGYSIDTAPSDAPDEPVDDTGATKKVKHVFNGFGFIGSTTYALPGVKGLMADGLNEDGSYKSVERIFDKMVMRTMAFDRSAFYGVVLDGEYTIQGDNYIEAAELPAAPDGYAFCYRTSDNTLWWTLNNNTWVRKLGVPVGVWTTSTVRISNFNPAKEEAETRAFMCYCSYNATQTICNVNNGASWSGTLARGIYYIRAQGGGGSGGTYGDFGWGRGSGGGSGAGFEGYILVKRNIICNVSTGAAVSSGKWSVNGNSTQIENMFIFGGGEGGKTNEALAVGGELTVIANDDYEILTAKYLGYGNGTKVVDGNKRFVVVCGFCIFFFLFFFVFFVVFVF